MAGDVQAGAAGDDDEFGELMGVGLEGFLRLASLDADRETVRMEPFVDAEDAFHWRDRAVFWPDSGGFFSVLRPESGNYPLTNP